MSTIYHKHHIVPKHAGGTDDPSNIVLLTVEEHAEAHRFLYEKYGRKGDLIAYKALLGTIGKEEMSHELAKLGAERGAKKGGEAVRDRKLGIHDPQKRHLKVEGGKKGSRCLVEFVKKSVWVHKNNKDTRIPKQDLQSYLDDGWTKGRLFSATRGKKSHLRKSVWINDGQMNKRVPRDQLEKFPNWSLGMI